MTTKQEPDSAHTDDPDDDQQDFLQGNDEPVTPDGETGLPHGDAAGKSSAPLQKRRRVTRACDTCRGKKIKCDGKQPCTHCTVYSYDCTYDQPSNRRRNPAPQYIEALENRLARAEALLKTVMPQADLNDPSLGNGALPPLVQFPQTMPRRAGQAGPSAEEQDSMMESMIEDTGALDLDDEGRPDYYGSSSGRVFYERISRHVGTQYSSAWRNANKMESYIRGKAWPTSFDSPRSTDSPADHDGTANTHDLPTKQVAQALCEVALEDAMSLLRFMHQPTFWAMFDRLYDTDPRTWTSAEHKYLPVLYAAMALGTLFAKTEDSKLETEGYEGNIESGFKYFKAASQMIDMTDIRELPHLQAVLLLTYFIQSSSKLATCYSYVGACLYGALRMGMHRNYPGRFNCLEDQMRKRVFWLVRKMDIYVGGILGMPILLSDDDIDQEYPAEVDDENITPEQIIPQAEGTFAPIAAANHHNRLMKILTKIIKHVYPLNPKANGTDHTSSISYAKVREVENDLQQWLDNMPISLRPHQGGDLKAIRMQQMLRMSFAHVQLTLYRPFLHYIVQDKERTTDKRFYAAAAACVSVSRNVIHIMSELNRRHLLIGAYWFQTYSTFWAILTLVYYAVENQDVPSAMAQDYFNDAIDGRDLLATLARRSNAADRCNMVLQQLFENLPPRFQRGRMQINATANGSGRKRHAQSHNRQPVADAFAQSASNPRTQARSHALGTNGAQRASTMPHHGHSGSMHAPSKSATLNTPNFAGVANPAAALTDAYGRPTHGLYTPPGSTERLGSPTQSASPSSLNYTSQPHIGVRHSEPNTSATYNSMQPAVPDMANVMFPSPDPFAYPNQPMTTLENHFGPMDGMNGGFDMVNATPPGLGGPQQQQTTTGEWLSGPTTGAPGHEFRSQPGFGMADWMQSQQQSRGQQAQTPNPQQQQQQMQPGQGEAINYDSLFVGQDSALGGMGMNGWFGHSDLV